MARRLATTTGQSLEQAAAVFADRVENGDVPMDQIGLSTGTANKHFNKLGQIHSFTRKAVPIAEPIDFGEFRPRSTRTNASAAALHAGTGRGDLPPAAMDGLRRRRGATEARLQGHPHGLFYLLLLVWYTGARREDWPS